MDSKTIQDMQSLIALKMRVAEQKSAQNNTDVSDETLAKDLEETRQEVTNDLVPVHEAGVLIRDFLTEVVTRSRVSRKFKKDLRNTHCRVLLSLYKRQRLLGSKDIGITLAQVKQDITPTCRMFVEPILIEAQQFGIVLCVKQKGKDYYSLNVSRYNDVQYFLSEEFK